MNLVGLKGPRQRLDDFRSCGWLWRWSLLIHGRGDWTAGKATPPSLWGPARSVPWAASADWWEHFWALRQGLARREAWVLKPHGADGAEPAAWSRAPAEKQTLSRTHTYCFHCETRKVVQAALCEQKPAWDMVLSYYFGDLCKRLSRRRVSFSCWRSIFSQRQSLQIRTPDRFGPTVSDFKKILFTVL